MRILKERDHRAGAKEDEELVKVNATGICGSDMHAYHGHDERRLPPLILGHEISGVIENSKKNVIFDPFGPL